jgi:membrane protein YdbS with pleckstrin-like domain
VERDEPDTPQHPGQPRPSGPPRPSREEPPPASVSITPVQVSEPESPASQPVIVSPVVTTTTSTRYDAAGLPVGPRHIEPSAAEPSRIVAKYLFDSERYCGEWRRHWIFVARWTAIGVISPFLVGYLVGVVGENSGTLVTIILALWVVLLGFVAYKLMDWYYDRFVLTNKRVMVVGGIVTRRVGMMPLLRVTDMAYMQSPLGRILNYGTFVLESAGQDQALREIKPLPHPGELYLLFCQEMYQPEGPSTKDDDGEGD